MKKLIAAAMAATMLMSTSISASAITTGQWDWGAAQKSIDSAVEKALSSAEYQITYDFNGGYVWSFDSGFSITTEYTCTAKGTHIVEELNPSRFMYELGGWECDGVIYQVGDEIVLTGDATLTAVWTRK